MPEGQERGLRFSTKQRGKHILNPSPHLPLPGHPLPKGEGKASASDFKRWLKRFFCFFGTIFGAGPITSLIPLKNTIEMKDDTSCEAGSIFLPHKVGKMDHHTPQEVSSFLVGQLSQAAFCFFGTINYLKGVS